MIIYNIIKVICGFCYLIYTTKLFFNLIANDIKIDMKQLRTAPCTDSELHAKYSKRYIISITNSIKWGLLNALFNICSRNYRKISLSNAILIIISITVAELSAEVILKIYSNHLNDIGCTVK